MKRAIGLLFCLAACGEPAIDGEVQGIVGEPAGSAFPEIGELMRYWDVGGGRYQSLLCTVVMIAPDVGVTSAVCAVDRPAAVPAGAPERLRFVTFAPSTIGVDEFSMRTESSRPASRIVLGLTKHPGFTDTVFDSLALVFLQSPAMTTRGVGVATPEDVAALRIGQPVEMVGYSKQIVLAAMATDPEQQNLTKAFSTGALVGRTPRGLAVSTLDGNGTCGGGDGGAVLYAGTGTKDVAGRRALGILVSFTCLSSAQFLRLDPYRAWISGEMLAACADGRRMEEGCTRQRLLDDGTPPRETLPPAPEPLAPLPSAPVAIEETPAPETGCRCVAAGGEAPAVVALAFALALSRRRRGALLIAAASLFGCDRGDGGIEAQSAAVIRGVEDVSPERWPAVVAVEGPSSICSGTLIATSTRTAWVLTAAHCVFEGGAPQLLRNVVVGPRVDTGQRFPVTRTLVHPEWGEERLTEGAYDPRLVNPTTGSPFDLALLEVPGLARTTLVPMRVHEERQPPLVIGATLAFAGYGQSVYAGGVGRRFRGEAVYVEDHVSASGARAYTLDERGTHAAICFGDSGGPLIGTSSTGGALVVGVTSAGPDRTQCDAEAYFANVRAAYTSFIAPHVFGRGTPAPPRRCASCSVAAAQPGGACAAEAVDLARPEVLAFLQCQGSRSTCTSRNAAGARIVERFRACAGTACGAACSPAFYAGLQCGFGVDDTNACAACIFRSDRCCDLSARCALEPACKRCQELAPSDPECAANALWQAAGACVTTTCRAECAREWAHFAASPPADAGVIVGPVDSGADAGAARDASPARLPGAGLDAATPGAPDAGGAEASGGCACVAPGARTPSPAAWLVFGFFALTLRRRAR